MTFEEVIALGEQVAPGGYATLAVSRGRWLVAWRVPGPDGRWALVARGAAWTQHEALDALGSELLHALARKTQMQMQTA